MRETRRTPREREYVVELEEAGRHRLAYTLGTLGGVALGALMLRGLRELVGREEAPVARARFRPGRLRRPPEVRDALVRLEDAVLDAFTGDGVLANRGIDVGAISEGIVELSGSVATRAEAAHAMAVAQGVAGVSTVVNRMEAEDERRRASSGADVGTGAGGEWTGLRSGMGTRRQGRDTDPTRTDDSQSQREIALDDADRTQFGDEGYFDRMGSGPGGSARPARFREDELDNQSPFGQHASPAQPPALNSQARVGQGIKPGVELNLEAADLPVKPHQHSSPRGRDD